jgi:hypothetical protein
LIRSPKHQRPGVLISKLKVKVKVKGKGKGKFVFATFAVLIRPSQAFETTAL